MHAKCYNVKFAEINLIKETFKCKACLGTRRGSLDSTPVRSIVPVFENSALSANENISLSFTEVSNEASNNDGIEIEKGYAHENNVSAGHEDDNSGDAVLAADGVEQTAIVINSVNNIINNATIDLIYAELCTLKANNAALHKLVSSLEDKNTKLLAKVDNLELLVRSKHCLCNVNANMSARNKTSSKSVALNNNNGHLPTNVLANTVISKPVSGSSSVVDLTNTNECVESTKLNSFADVAKQNFNFDSHALGSQNVSSINSQYVIFAKPNNSWNVVSAKHKKSKILVGTRNNNDIDVFNKFKWLHISPFIYYYLII